MMRLLGVMGWPCASYFPFESFTYCHDIDIAIMEIGLLKYRLQVADLPQLYDTVIHILTNIRGKWQPLLPQSVYSKVRNLMLETVVSRLTKEVLSLNDIGADETVQLRNLLAGFMERLQAFADTDDSTNEEASVDEKVGNIVSENKIEKRVASWRKLRRFSDLLDMSLIPITQAWESGDLSRCGFTSAEKETVVCIRTEKWGPLKTFRK
ncbi:hypothetical protein O6H91_Y528100 [Diphasiastrum complanatum]|nr:hypothetical protein O6H91_Y528100 [Diphasiastrum complanatum]